MCLWVEQIRGDRVELANQATDLFNAGNIQGAAAIFENLTGRTTGEHNKIPGNPWMQFCMPRDIKSYIEDHVYDRVDKRLGRESRHNDDQEWYDALREDAQREYGGEWRVRYEY